MMTEPRQVEPVDVPEAPREGINWPHVGRRAARYAGAALVAPIILMALPMFGLYLLWREGMIVIAFGIEKER